MARRICLLVSAAVLVAACGGSSDDPAATPSSTDLTTTVAVTSTTPTTTESAPPTTSAPTDTAPTTAPPPTATTATSAPASSVPVTSAAPPTTGAPSIRDLIDSGAVLNLAHAGGDQDAPHSTPFAFAEAVAAGADVLELDVQLSADGVLVVQHDDTVDKTTEATGPVSALTYDELHALDNAYWFSPECWPCKDRPTEEYVYRGVRTGTVAPPPGYTADDFAVPTFREIATRFPDLPLDIEIKGTFPDAVAVAERLSEELVELERERSVVVVSFDDQVVDAFHAIAPDVSVSPGLGRLTEWFLSAAELEPHFEVLQLPPFQGEIEVITAEVVDRIHAEGRVVWVWPDDASSQENETFYRELLADGVDGVIAGRPAAMTAALTD
ncbi:MAG: glycerophosphodiester phosphodiesterase family protein [Ilumatobacteraceae bacterium]|nr:glycerophosphodiester phosphodiesterase family protein [Ilumatobacteraceae bacterium]